MGAVRTGSGHGRPAAQGAGLNMHRVPPYSMSGLIVNVFPCGGGLAQQVASRWHAEGAQRRWLPAGTWCRKNARYVPQLDSTVPRRCACKQGASDAHGACICRIPLNMCHISAAAACRRGGNDSLPHIWLLRSAHIMLCLWYVVAIYHITKPYLTRPLLQSKWSNVVQQGQTAPLVPLWNHFQN